MFTFDMKVMDLKIFLLIISYLWFANDVIKNMITQIMTNLLNNFYDNTSVSVPNLKSFGQMKAELWAKKFWGF